MLNVVEDVDGVLCKVLIDLLTYARLKIRWRIRQLVGVWSYIVISMEHSLLLRPVFTPTWTDLPSLCTRCYPPARPGLSRVVVRTSPRILNACFQQVTVTHFHCAIVSRRGLFWDAKTTNLLVH